VVVPYGFDTAAVPALLEQRSEWVERHLARMAQLYGDATALEPPRTLELTALGHSYRIDYRQLPSRRNSLRREGAGRLLVSHDGEGGWRLVLKRWLAREGRDHLVPWLERVSRESGLVYSGVTLRGQRSRWGSCSARGRISLNYGLLFLAPELVHQLLIHELCHTVHLNHSADFWALVARHSPDYRRLEWELRRASHRLPLWFHQR
jgi:predicted metal-dependent hydrolase